ncbi:MAG: hypothetical protein M1814_005100, partial [Vezdaea aestivalis]
DVNYKATLPSVKEERYKSLEELAIFLSLDPDRWIFRRFEKLRIANALRLQSHLNELEAEWDALMEYSGHIVQTKRLDQLNVEIQQTLTAYGEIAAPDI